MGGIFGTGSSGQSTGTSGYQLPGLNPFQREGQAANFANAIAQATGGNAQRIGQQMDFQQGLQNQLGGLANQVGTNFGKANLNTEFQGPQFGQGLDARGQGLLSQELQNRQAGLQQQQNQISQQFRNNPALAKILGNQVQSQAQLANNPLAFQAAEARNSQMINEANATNQAQQLTNQARQNQVDSGNNATLLGNQALGQRGNFLQSAGQAGQGIVNLGNQLLGNYQQGLDVFAPKNQSQQQSGRSGGLLSGLIGK